MSRREIQSLRLYIQLYYISDMWHQIGSIGRVNLVLRHFVPHFPLKPSVEYLPKTPYHNFFEVWPSVEYRLGRRYSTLGFCFGAKAKKWIYYIINHPPKWRSNPEPSRYLVMDKWHIKYLNRLQYKNIAFYKKKY